MLYEVITVGIMVMVLEFALGHSTKGSAPLALRRLGKNFEWIGWLAVATAFIITTYYTAIIACVITSYSIHYTKLYEAQKWASFWRPLVLPLA